MKIIILTLSILFSVQSSLGKERLRSYKFFKKHALSEKPKYKYNQYEGIISGASALLIGNVGYFTTDSKSMKLTYSLVQTIGFLNIGKGVYDYYRPQIYAEQYKLLRSYKSSSKANTVEYFSHGIIKNIALEDKAKRLSVLYTSSLLASQYLINIIGDKLRGDENDQLNNIYYFLAGVNTVAAAYSYFSRSIYEEHYYSITPVVIPSSKIIGLQASFQF
ncbi:hypothetical protein [Halobacteriovorax sp.]|uniref:hypothetical protein n=1 Tax=Halobacteriovorax sp. TaxID=2020862 RepID=UPI0035677EAA